MGQQRPKVEEKPETKEKMEGRRQETPSDQRRTEQKPGERLEYAEPETQDVNYLIEQCHTNVDKGSIEEAKKLYSQILSAYEQAKDNPGSDAEQLYGRIKRLYYRLQIYA